MMRIVSFDGCLQITRISFQSQLMIQKARNSPRDPIEIMLRIVTTSLRTRPIPYNTTRRTCISECLISRIRPKDPVPDSGKVCEGDVQRKGTSMQVVKTVENALQIGITGCRMRPAAIDICYQEGPTVGWRRRENLNLINDYLSGLREVVSVDYLIISFRDCHVREQSLLLESS
jgi:hypothetical protein